MISYQTYKLIHLTGLFMVVLGLGGVVLQALASGLKDYRWRKGAAITHGVGLILALVGGFGLLARLGVMHGELPNWVMVKVGLWVLLGGMLVFAKRLPQLGKGLWFGVIAIVMTGAYLGINKPF